MHQPPLLCDTATSQLVLIDIQEKLAAAMKPAVREQLLRNTAILSQAAGALGIPVVHTEQYPKGLGPTEPELAAHLNDLAIEKTCFSCYRAPDFVEQLRVNARRQIVLGGMESHVCVLQTATQLQEHGYQVFVVEDAIASRRKTHHRNALARLRQAGVSVIMTESALFEWLRDAQHAQFRTLSKLIR
ncbi:hydrolase [Thiohalophilus sp.]|uniref:hydrolase n=1 Tax=Thiohalophilus sp. TaxID=3028392 RepID=UPI002ACE6F05|nr:hydrolase [Thiohalophilus sp.]MDZ7661037.1 hydrolase [Thiohalophilus sp.]